MDKNINVHLSHLPEEVLQWNDLYKNERISIEKYVVMQIIKEGRIFGRDKDKMSKK